MPINFGNIPVPKIAKRPTDPIEIFRTSHVTDRAVNDLWLAQGDALRQWDKDRSIKDTAVVLNTGAGKTLVGLLIAQSLVNETNGHVLYACSSIQLVEQTAAKAAGYGIDVTTYFKKNFSNHSYKQGLSPCVTTYQALFNGRSRFFRENLSAVVFDDAHTAEHLIRDHFTLKISRSIFATLFVQLSNLFRAYFDRIGKGVGYSEMLDRQDAYSSWFVPPFALNEHLSEVQRLLISSNLTDFTETVFAWEHLKNHVDLCACFVDGAEISFSPAIIPVSTLPYFQKNLRRLYLSATLPAGDAFLRTFGRTVKLTIAPTTTAGECERLVLVPSLNKSCAEEDTRVAKRIIEPQKALIIVPSYGRASEWADVVAIQQSGDVTGQVEGFKAALAPAKLLLVGRYDGVDLPGDTCRVMVIDGLPSGVGPLERFLWEQLRMAKVLRSMVASRVVQSFGRIFRGMSDHGVVVLTGRSLVDWLLTPINREVLPEFLRRQLELGIAASRQATSAQDLVDAVDQCLNRDGQWTKYYQENMSLSSAPQPRRDDAGELKVAQAQVDFGHSLWARDYSNAVKQLEKALGEIFDLSLSAGAWAALWLGYSYDLMGDANSARALYRRAHSAAQNIPPLEIQHMASAQSYSDQILDVARYLDCGAQGFAQALSRFDVDLSALKAPGATVAQVEEAVRCLGGYLGLKSTRPDKEYGTGPDVLWFLEHTPAFCLELKTDKTSADHYWKKDVSQIPDHIQWVKDNCGTVDILPAFVGPTLPAAKESNPLPVIEVIELSEFSLFADRLRAALVDIGKTALPLTVRQEVHEVFTQRKLIWPGLLDGIAKKKLKTIKK
jgi:tetratricopeptide (TPR) repeat protein